LAASAKASGTGSRSASAPPWPPRPRWRGRYLGGRPPYGYLLIDAGPHPNPAKAADGKRLHILAIDEPAAAVVRRIFAEFLAGFGIYAIAERLTTEGIPCPSAHDPDRNRHRCGIAWSKYAIRAILTNPRYTGRQVWNRQRKDEVLLDVHDVALGHTTKMRWNDQDKWIYSEQNAHPPIIDEDAFSRAQDLLTARRGTHGPHKPHKSQHAYALRGLLFCGVCERRMQGHWANAAPYYRCRFPAEYALANRLTHPLNVTLRQDALLGPLDEWLASKFDPSHLTGTIDELAAAAIGQTVPHAAEDELNAKIAECARKLDQYRATLDAGADPVTVARWITETEAERAKYQALKRAAPPHVGAPSMSREEISSVVSALSDLLAVLRAADPADKAEIYAQLGLRLTYSPGEDPAVLAEVRIASAQHWQFEGVRGVSRLLRTCRRSLVC
jgi:site-specific DNA recombinase